MTNHVFYFIFSFLSFDIYLNIYHMHCIKLYSSNNGMKFDLKAN